LRGKLKSPEDEALNGLLGGSGTQAEGINGNVEITEKNDRLFCDISGFF